MTVSTADLRAYVNASASDDDFISTCLTEAHTLVAGYVGEFVVPPSVLDRAALEVGSELFHRRKAPNGIMQFATPDASPVRVARDPMVGAYPLLNRYVSGGFA